MVFLALTEDIDSGNSAFIKRNFLKGLQDFNTGAGVGTLGLSGAGNQRYFPSLCQRMASMATLVNKSKYQQQGRLCRQQV